VTRRIIASRSAQNDRRFFVLSTLFWLRESYSRTKDSDKHGDHKHAPARQLTDCLVIKPRAISVVAVQQRYSTRRNEPGRTAKDVSRSLKFTNGDSKRVYLTTSTTCRGIPDCWYVRVLYKVRPDGVQRMASKDFEYMRSVFQMVLKIAIKRHTQ